MHFQKLSSLVLAAFTSIVLVAPSVSPTDQPRYDRQSVSAPIHPQVADGGAPVPPVPPNPHFNGLVADGGAPVPPVPPPIPPSNLTADGGAPVPPVPPKPFPKTLVADGGAPVPPVPKPLMTTFVAV